MFLEKLRKIFSHRSLAFCLVFFISFSIFSFGFGFKKEVKANPLVPVIEQELAPVIISILGTLGVTVSLPTAHDFVQQELEKSSELSKQMAEGTLPIQQLRDKGFYVSKQFVQSVSSSWNDFISNTTVLDGVPVTARQVVIPKRTDLKTDYSFTFPKGSRLVIAFNDGYQHYREHLMDDIYTQTGTVVFHPTGEDHIIQVYDGSISGECLCSGTAFDLDYTSYFFVDTYLNYTKSTYSNTKIDRKTIDSVKPLSNKQGIFLPMPIVNNVSKAIDSPIPVGVGNVQTGTLSPPVDLPVGGSVPTDVPSVVGGSSVGAIPWGNDGTVSIPNDKPINKPVDGSNSKPVDGFLGFLQSILDILKQILSWLQNFFDAFLEFLKYLLVPSDGYFVDTFNHFRTDLEGKFGFDAGPLKDLSSNSSVVTPQFIYNFSVLGVPVTLDFSFIVKVVPYCHIIFGGLTAIFLCWYNLRNILLIIRGTSYIEGSNSTGQSEKRG